MIKVYEFSKINGDDTVYAKNIYLFGFIPIYIKECRYVESTDKNKIGFKSNNDKKESTPNKVDEGKGQR